MNWKEDWNEDIGLWSRKGPGHTDSTKDLDTVHSGPYAASGLLAAAQVEALDEIEVERMLSTLRDMQWTEDDSMRGCMRWYWEDKRPHDTNAAFFIGLSLIVMRKQFYERLDERCRALLDEILFGLDVWFETAVKQTSYFYPNKYLGDLVCKWILIEIMNRTDIDCLVAERMRKAATYWQENKWGWGEHLSDLYAGLCLNELSALLMLSERLPEDLRKTYTKLAGELLAIEDGFDGGPRVPALRSYSFQQPKTHVNYRDKIKPWKEVPRSFTDIPDLGNLMYGLGWHQAMPERRPRQHNLTISCFGGAVATACVENDIRLGSMSTFPVMPSAEHPTWGLSWQCFPVAFSRGESDWGFLQWETMENGIRRAHPASGGPMAHIPKALTETVMPPVCGQTYAIQRGSGILILRVMRIIPTSWKSVTDRFRLVGGTAEVNEAHRDGWSQLVLTYPEREVSLHHVALVKGQQPERASNAFGEMEWNMTYDAPRLHQQRIITHLWAISLDGPIDTEPKVHTINEGLAARSKEELVREVQWEWGSKQWKVVIDPLSETPLVEV